jgi:hypothetical protein
MSVYNMEQNTSRQDTCRCLFLNTFCYKVEMILKTLKPLTLLTLHGLNTILC